VQSDTPAGAGADRGAERGDGGSEETSQLRPTVQWNPETSTHQVRVGAFATRDEALRLATRLTGAAFPGAFVVEDGGPPAAGRIRLLETGEELTVATVVPSQAPTCSRRDAALLPRDPGGPASESGSLTVVNVVHLEDYLRGVVPNELSPLAFPAMEALKAQAVAGPQAMSSNHKGEFAARGYDICATQACQVYRGKSSDTR